MKIESIIRCILSVAALAAFSLASYWSGRLAYADSLYRTNTLKSVTTSVLLDSGNARYHAWLAEHQENAGRNPIPELDRAIALNPADSSLWIRRGLRAEVEQDYPNAERYLLQASRTDKQFDPRWTLMNYYFRRGDTENFWRWTRNTLAMSYGDLSPVFRLCWAASQDAEAIRQSVPPRREILRKYLVFLVSENRLDAAEPVAREFSASAQPDDRPTLTDYCDKALEQGRVSAAIVVWNMLCGRKLLPYAALTPETGLAVTNGAFAVSPLQQGFDWHISPILEISAVQTDSPVGLKLSLSGKQPEKCELLWQYIPLIPGRRYRFRSQYRTSGIAAESGVRWSIFSSAARSPTLFRSSQLAGDDWKQEQGTFANGEGVLARLVLISERMPGTVRPEGSIFLGDTAIEPVQ